MRRPIVAWGAVLLCGAANAQTMGLHLGSLHVPANPELQGVNTGIYFRSAEDWTAGAYRNSYGKPSAYAGETGKWRGLDVTAGLVIGYRVPVLPFIAVSYALPQIGEMTPRITFLPAWPSSVVHLSIEQRF